MPQTLSKDGQKAPSGDICSHCLGAMVDAIPSSLAVSDEIDRHVTQPNKQLAIEIAAWAVQAYRQKIGSQRAYTEGFSFPLLWSRSEYSLDVRIMVEDILIKKGWYISHNFAINEVYISPCQPAEEVFRGPRSFY